MKTFGLIGYPLSHSFSEKYFTDKFIRENISGHQYKLFELPDIKQLPALLNARPDLCGLNVTVPHKQVVIPFLDDIDPETAKIGAVNVITFKEGKTKGYNSDYEGFRLSLLNFYVVTDSSKALILGTGGASKAVAAALNNLQVPFKFVSRNPVIGQLNYTDLTAELVQDYSLIINTTPLGTYPKEDTFPDIPYEALTSNHYLYDLVYNPAETVFLKKGKEAGAQTKNGYEMLVLQAEVAWQIWNNQR